MAWTGRKEKKYPNYKYKKTKPKFYLSDDKKILYGETLIVHWDESEEPYKSGFIIKNGQYTNQVYLASIKKAFVKEVDNIYQAKKKKLIEEGYVKPIE